MPQTINGSAGSYGNALTIPVDGEGASMATMSPAFQALLNNDALFNALLSSGVLRVRTVANDAALLALAGMANGEVALVKNRGLYLYVDPDATAAADPWVRQPAVGTGRWFHSLYALQAAAGGLATLDGGGLLPTSQLPAIATAGRYIRTVSASNYIAGVVSNVPGNFSTVNGAGLPINVSTWQVGDRFFIDGTLADISSNGGGDGWVRVLGTVVISGSPTFFRGPKFYLPNGGTNCPGYRPYLDTTIPSGGTGTWSFTFEIGSDAVATVTSGANPQGFSLRLDHYRD